MAKYNEREGNSCHIHLSLRDADGDAGLRRRPARWRVAACSSSFLAGQLAGAARAELLLRAEHQLLQAVPARLVRARPRWRGASTTGPARCGSSGTAPSLRFENRLPGGDVNPYLAVAAMIAAGLHGVDNELTLEPAVRRATPTPATRRACRPRCARRPTCSTASALAREALRRRRRRPLRERRPGRARRLRRRRHRLGTHPQLRADVRTADHATT